MGRFALGGDKSFESRAIRLLFCSLFFVAVALSLFGSLLPNSVADFSVQRAFLCLLIVLFVTVGFGAYFSVPNISSRSLWSLSLLVCIVVLVLAQAFFSGNHFKWVEPGLYIGFLASVILFGGLLGRNLSVLSVLEPVSVILGLSIVLYGFLSLNYYWFSLSDPEVKISDYLPWGFVNIRYWSHVATWLLPLVPLILGNRLASRSKLWKVAVMLGGAIWVWMVVLSSARGTSVSLVAGTGLAVLLFGRASLPWLKQFGAVLLCGGILWMLLSVVIPALLGFSFEGRELKMGSSGRWILWQESFVMSLQNFPFGMGPQAWLYHEPLVDGYKTSKAFGHPHNMYLMWAAEYGWLVVFLMFGLFFSAVFRLVGARRRLKVMTVPHSELILCGFMVSTVSALVHASISSVFLAPASMLIGLFVLIIFYAMLQRPEDRSFKLSSPVLRVKPIPAALCLTGLLAVSLWWLGEVYHYHQAMVRDLPVYLEQPSNAYFPRFWYHGYFPRSDSL